MAWRTPEELREDPWVAAKVDRALAKYDGVLLPEEIAWIRDQIFEMFANDVDASDVLRSAHPRIREESGKVAASGEHPTQAADGDGTKK